MTDGATHVHDVSTHHRQPACTLTEGATLDIGRLPSAPNTRLFAERLTLPVHCRLHGTSRGLRVDCGSRTEGVWLFTLAPDALEDPRAALEPVTFDDLTSSLLAAKADGSLVRFIRCAQVVIEVPARLGAFTHHTGPRFDEPRPPLDSLPEVRTPAMLFARGHVYHLDPPVAPPPLTGGGALVPEVSRARALQTPKVNAPSEPAPRDAHWVVRGDATGVSELLDRAEQFERWLRARARAGAFLLRRRVDGTLAPYEVDVSGGVRALTAHTPPPTRVDGRWPGWFAPRAPLAETTPDAAVTRAIARYREHITPANSSMFSPTVSLLDLVREELGAVSPSTLVTAWMQVARRASSRDAMTLASALWMMSCIAVSRLDELDATEVALLIVAALHLLGEPKLPSLPRAIAPTAGFVSWSQAHLDALAASPSRRVSVDAALAFDRDPLAKLKELDGANHRLRAVTAHALIYATLVPSRALDDGRELHLRPGLALHLDASTISAIDKAIDERRYMESSKVAPFLKRWSHKRAWLADPLSAWKRHSFEGYELHAQRTAAWVRAAKEHSAEGLARIIEGA